MKKETPEEWANRELEKVTYISNEDFLRFVVYGQSLISLQETDNLTTNQKLDVNTIINNYDLTDRQIEALKLLAFNSFSPKIK